jgi:DNA binding domain, excisionase family
MDMEYFTVAEAAKKLKVTPQAIYKWIAQGRLKAVYVGADRRVTSAAIEEFVQKSTKAAEVDDSDTIKQDIQMPMFATP